MVWSERWVLNLFAFPGFFVLVLALVALLVACLNHGSFSSFLSFPFHVNIYFPLVVYPFSR
jgi:hypothetical protein